MPSNKPRITVYTDEETNSKLAYIAKKENRSSSNYTEYLIKKDIERYELEHGEIEITQITRNEAWENEKQTIKNRRTQGFTETMKQSLNNGLNFGKAKK